MSRSELIRKAVDMANRVGYALVATSDRNGLAHVAASRRVEAEPGNRVAVSEWFCPGTLANLQENPQISVVVWDPASDKGYQVIGKSVALEDTAMMDGFSPAVEENPPPQVERKIRIEVNRILDFSHAPHSDQEKS
jgi:hypothetical protein